MPLNVFFDSSAILAWASDRDQHHAAAIEEFRRLDASKRRFVLTTDVFDEVLTLLLARRGHSLAVEIGEALRAGAPYRIADIDAPLRDEAWLLFRRYADHPLSFTDCTSIVTMRRLGIEEVFSFDSDFDRAGVIRSPR